MAKDLKWVHACVLTHFSCVCLQPYGLWPAKLLSLWDSSGKNTGVDCRPSTRGSSHPRDWTWVSCISSTSGRFFAAEPLGKPKILRSILNLKDHMLRIGFCALTILPNYSSRFEGENNTANLVFAGSFAPLNSDQCKEIEENNRMGETRNLFKKIRDTKGTFHAKIGTIKDRNCTDLTEAEDIKKRW